MPTYAKDGKIATLFLFNDVISRFGVPHAIMIDHRSHFCNHSMDEISTKLGFRHEQSTPYYPQDNLAKLNPLAKSLIPCFIG